MTNNNNPLSSPLWRINNLYKIVNKRGQKITFNLNWAQEELYHNMWYCNVILKARQLGISTFVCLLFLDRCLFNPNQSAGIIAHTLEDAQQMFRRVKIAYDSLPTEIKQIISADNDTSQMLKFSNGSSLRVGTSLRSSTFQYLHISEFGKICCRYPEKAKEIVSGSLNTVEAGQYIFIESTAEGREGYFYDICKHAENQKKSKVELSKLDFRFNFFPWWKEPSYRIGNTFSVTDEMQEYFNQLKSLDIHLEDEQKSWYIAKEIMQKENMRREYPSTPEESWEISNEGIYYCKQMTNIRSSNRIGFVPYEEQLETHTAWDLGFNDANSIVFFQVYRKEIRIIDYEEGSGESLAHWIKVVKDKPYTYGKHIAPHDIIVKEYSSGISRQTTARQLGINFLPAQRTEIIPGIDAVRSMLGSCWIDERKCSKLIKALDNYKKDWDERNGCWRSQPLHNWASHGADSIRTMATGLNYIINKSQENTHNPNLYMASRFG